MKTLIQEQSKLLINPVFLVITTPILWIVLFLLTKSFIGTIYLHFWLGLMTTCFALFNDKDIRESWDILIFTHTLFYISLFEVYLYIRVLI